MKTLLRLAALFGVGLLAYLSEVALWALLSSRPIDPMAPSVGLFIYVAAFVVAIFTVPGIFVPMPTTRPAARILVGTLIFAVVWVLFLSLFGGSFLDALLASLFGLPSGIAVSSIATFWPRRA